MPLTEDDFFEHLAFLIASARLCVDEPKLYGAFRLVDAASRLLGFVLHSRQLQDEQFLQQLKDEIDEKNMWLVSYQERYVAFLDHLTRTVAGELKERASMALQMSVDEAQEGGQVAR